MKTIGSSARAVVIALAACSYLVAQLPGALSQGPIAASQGGGAKIKPPFDADTTLVEGTSRFVSQGRSLGAPVKGYNSRDAHLVNYGHISARIKSAARSLASSRKQQLQSSARSISARRSRARSAAARALKLSKARSLASATAKARARSMTGFDRPPSPVLRRRRDDHAAAETDDDSFEESFSDEKPEPVGPSQARSGIFGASGVCMCPLTGGVTGEQQQRQGGLSLGNLGVLAGQQQQQQGQQGGLGLGHLAGPVDKQQQSQKQQQLGGLNLGGLVGNLGGQAQASSVGGGGSGGNLLESLSGLFSGAQQTSSSHKSGESKKVKHDNISVGFGPFELFRVKLDSEERNQVELHEIMEKAHLFDLLLEQVKLKKSLERLRAVQQQQQQQERKHHKVSGSPPPTHAPDIITTTTTTTDPPLLTTHRPRNQQTKHFDPKIQLAPAHLTTRTRTRARTTRKPIRNFPRKPVRKQTLKMPRKSVRKPPRSHLLQKPCRTKKSFVHHHHNSLEKPATLLRAPEKLTAAAAATDSADVEEETKEAPASKTSASLGADTHQRESTPVDTIVGALNLNPKGTGLRSPEDEAKARENTPSLFGSILTGPSQVNADIPKVSIDVAHVGGAPADGTTTSSSSSSSSSSNQVQQHQQQSSSQQVAAPVETGLSVAGSTPQSLVLATDQQQQQQQSQSQRAESSTTTQTSTSSTSSALEGGEGALNSLQGDDLRATGQQLVDELLHQTTGSTSSNKESDEQTKGGDAGPRASEESGAQQVAAPVEGSNVAGSKPQSQGLSADQPQQQQQQQQQESQEGQKVQQQEQQQEQAQVGEEQPKQPQQQQQQQQQQGQHGQVAEQQQQQQKVAAFPPILNHAAAHQHQQQHHHHAKLAHKQHKYPLYESPRVESLPPKCRAKLRELIKGTNELISVVELIGQKTLSDNAIDFAKRDLLSRKLAKIRQAAEESLMAANLAKLQLLNDTAKLAGIELIRLSNLKVALKYEPNLKKLSAKLRKLYGAYRKSCKGVGKADLPL